MIHPNPKQSVLNLSTLDRVVGGMVSLDVLNEPETDQAHDLVGDAFFGLYKGTPVPVEEAPAGREINHAVMKYAVSTDDFERLHPETTNNLPACLTTAPLYWQALMADDTVAKAMKAQEKADEERDKAEQAQQEAEQKRQDADSNPDDEQAQADAAAAEQAAQQAQTSASAAVQAMQEIADQVGKNPMSKAAFKSAANQAKGEAEKVNAFMKSWGVDPGSLEYGEAKQIVGAAQSDAGNRLAEVLGRLKGIATATLKANKRTSEGVAAEVAMTKDVSRLFTEELAKLNAKNPRLMRADAVRRLTTTGMIGWCPLETPKKAGNFVVYVDKSGSMAGVDYETACAIAIAIAQATRDENEDRTYVLKVFDTQIKHGATVTSESDWKSHMALTAIRISPYDGTSYGEVVDEIVMGFEQSMNDEHGGTSDAMVITDGGAAPIDGVVAQRLKEAKLNSGSKLFYVQIGFDYGYSEQANSLRSLSDIGAVFNDATGFVAGVETLAQDICEQLAENV